MKTFFLISLTVLLAINSYAQVKDIKETPIPSSFDMDIDDNISPVMVKNEAFINPKRGNTSEWRDFQLALYPLVNNPKNIYTLLFPDTILSNSEDDAHPGSYILGRVRSHAVGAVFCPSSDVLEAFGYDRLETKQPYSLDSIAIQYNYQRFTANTIPDTLIVNIFQPGKLLYYTNSGNPRGCSMGYDLQNNKGRNFSQEINIPLKVSDTISYKGRGKGVLYIPLTNFNIVPGSYGNPVGITWSFKPSFSYTISDTLNADWEQYVPHSKINHFYFWNFSDYTEYEVEEWNNGVFIYSWTNYPRYKDETGSGNGFVYWRGSTFTGKHGYPYAKFKITYDPDWVGLDEQPAPTFAITPNPATGKLAFHFNNPGEDRLVIKLLNLYGQQVAFLYEGNCQAGQNAIAVMLREVPTGLYFIQFTLGGNSYMEKLIINN